MRVRHVPRRAFRYAVTQQDVVVRIDLISVIAKLTDESTVTKQDLGKKGKNAPEEPQGVPRNVKRVGVREPIFKQHVPHSQRIHLLDIPPNAREPTQASFIPAGT